MRCKNIFGHKFVTDMPKNKKDHRRLCKRCGLVQKRSERIFEFWHDMGYAEDKNAVLSAWEQKKLTSLEKENKRNQEHKEYIKNKRIANSELIHLVGTKEE